MSHPTHEPHAVTRLDPLALPLRGAHLIEASAGTGKTFTIAMLYVRLVLGHGGDVGHGRSLTPPEILVVTFTEAATQELRDRIRARLTQAAACFRVPPHEVSEPKTPDLLHDLRRQYSPDAWPMCARKLELAAEWMDEAAVSTIHGWCNRMLHEHAFDSLSLFTQTLETDARELRGQVVRDYWRQFYYPLPRSNFEEVTACWRDPLALDEAVERWLGRADLLPDAPPPIDSLAQCARDRHAYLQALKAPWPQWVQELRQALEEANRDNRFNRVRLGPANYTRWLTTIEQWATSDAATLTLGDGAWNRLTPTGIAQAWNNDQPLDHPALHQLSQVREAQERLPSPYPALFSHATRWIAAQLNDTQRRRSQLGFDDLLRHLDTALQGENGPRLAQIIRQQFPVALIDEFQDTDPVQYRIFERIYDLPNQHDDRALILIGDPKQAIYAFRGADIHTYLKARAAVGDRLHTLGTNHRSTQALVSATNHCFSHMERQAGSAGAFLFRQGNLNPVPFHGVDARGLDESFQVQGVSPVAISLNVLPPRDKRSKDSYINEMAAIAAAQLVDWFHLASAGQAGFAQAQGPLRPLQPSDIAILVNNRLEADSMRRALARRGIRSVYLSDQDTVFQTPQAREVSHWLQACAEPDNPRLLKAALTSPTLGQDYAALEALNHDEMAWEERLLQFKGYQEIWRRQGVLPMIRRILLDFNCASRLLPGPPDALGQSGERVLTDVLHLAELLQQATFTLEGEHALLRFLAEQLANPKAGADDRRLRLESDMNLVQVITIHKSKGLEYPLVMLPFIGTARPLKATQVPFTWHDEAGEPRVALSADEHALARADRERLGEDVRKLYVALTRARHHTWMGLAHVDTLQHRAIGYLLGLQHVDAASLEHALGEFVRGQPQWLVVQSPAAHELRYQDESSGLSRGQACRPRRPAREHWWISSYSHLPIGAGQPTRTHRLEDSARTDNWLESQQELATSRSNTSSAGQSTPAPAPGTALGHSMHRFPKGAEPGTFLHDVLEWCANLGFGTVLDAPDRLHELITQRCQTYRWDVWVDPLCDWIRQLLITPLPAGSTSIQLGQVASAKAEMEFWLETRHLDLQALDHAVLQHTLGGRPRPGLSPDVLNGMFKGFIDLVLEHEGRYYLVDYKSNWLGPDEAAYTPEAMDEAIRANRYDLQYVLYLLALHRLLRSRLPDYDYDRHVGGAVYVFVRGIAAPSAGVHFECPPRTLIEQLDSWFAGTNRSLA